MSETSSQRSDARALEKRHRHVGVFAVTCFGTRLEQLKDAFCHTKIPVPNWRCLLTAHGCLRAMYILYDCPCPCLLLELTHR